MADYLMMSDMPGRSPSSLLTGLALHLESFEVVLSAGLGGFPHGIRALILDSGDTELDSLVERRHEGFDDVADASSP